MARKNNYFKYLFIPFLIILLSFFLYPDFLTISEDGAGSAEIVTNVTTNVPTVAGSSTEIFETHFPVYFTDPIRPYEGQTTGGIEDNLILLIDGAKTSIDVAVFEFDLEDVAAALIRAEKRGVTVRVVHDDEHTQPDPQIGELIEAGISTVPDNRSAYMHNKFFVIDSYCVWTGSFNISVNAAFKNNENAAVICDIKLAKNYETEFEEMFAGNFGANSEANTPYPSLVVDGVKIENYFAPEDEVMTQVIEAVSQSRKSVHFMAFSFTDDNLAQEMINRMANGVEVAGIFESRGADSKYSSCLMLLQNHAKIGLDGNPNTFHHKVIIIDEEIVIFGSFNYSANADTQNDENLLIVYDKAFATAYEQEFAERMAESLTPQVDKCVHE